MTGVHGWAAALGVVAVWDLAVLPEHTLCAAFRRAPKAVTVPATAFVVAHLFGLVPESIDPLHIALRTGRKARCRFTTS